MAATEEHPMQALNEFLPDNSFEQTVAFLHQYKVHLTVTRERKSILGDYRNAMHGKNHRISVNGNLNKYAFLLTLLHELAHLLTFEKYKHTVQAHGKEWKHIYASLLKDFLQKKIFPHDIEQAIMQSLHNPAASTCAEESLTRVLKKYDSRSSDMFLVEELPHGAIFKTKDGRMFQRGEKQRKRYRCKELGTNVMYLFSAVYEVKKVG
ncbi:MAG TPA: SprT-like domain-containing protein [Chitinophagaceae bacterium]|nr:SprT-like domain-containing protein [Chitinophagaceae bacterium]